MGIGMFKMSGIRKLNTELDADMTNQAESALLSMGLNLDEAVKDFVYSVAINRVLPFPDNGERPYNQETIEAMNEDMTDYPRFKNMKDVLEHVESESL